MTTYKYLNTIESDHPGRKYVRTCLDSFEAEGPDGNAYQCLVHRPLWQSLGMLQYRHSRHKLTEELLRQVLSCVLRAIDYLHSECHLVHTGMEDSLQFFYTKIESQADVYVDIKASNIMLGLDDDSVLQAFEANEMANPSPRNIYPDRTIYHSRLIDRPKAIGLPVLSDFGLARFEGGNADDDIQPEIYRAPEVLLDMDWNYPVDIWNVGAMVWYILCNVESNNKLLTKSLLLDLDLFYDKHLFDAYDPATNKLSNKYHTSEMAAYLGPPPREFLEKSETSWKYFDRSGRVLLFFNCLSVCLVRIELLRFFNFLFQTGRLITGFDLSDKLSLDAREERLEGEKKEQFLNFIRSMLRWDPNDRLTARELLDDPWLNDYKI